MRDMNTNDYSFQIIADQHRQDLYAEAANDRLARLATADRTPLWRRILHRHAEAVSAQPKPLLTAHHAAR
jgi:hypothetical protein